MFFKIWTRWGLLIYYLCFVKCQLLVVLKKSPVLSLIRIMHQKLLIIKHIEDINLFTVGFLSVTKKNEKLLGMGTWWFDARWKSSHINSKLFPKQVGFADNVLTHAPSSSRLIAHACFHSFIYSPSCTQNWVCQFKR